MNKRLRPWAITLAVLEISLLTVAALTSIIACWDYLAMLATAVHEVAVLITLCGLFGKIIEIKRGRQGALTFALGAAAVLLIIACVLTFLHEKSYPSGVYPMYFGINFMLMPLAIIGLISAQIIITILYHQDRKYSYNAAERLCFPKKKAMWIAVTAAMVLILAGCTALDIAKYNQREETYLAECAARRQEIEDYNAGIFSRD